MCWTPPVLRSISSTVEISSRDPRARTHRLLARISRGARARLTLSWNRLPKCALPLMPGPLLVMKAAQSSIGPCRRSSRISAMTRVREVRELSQNYSVIKRSASGNTLLNEDSYGDSRVAGLPRQRVVAGLVGDGTITVEVAVLGDAVGLCSRLA